MGFCTMPETDLSTVPMNTMINEIITRYVQQTKKLLSKITTGDGSTCKEMEILLQIDSEYQHALLLLAKHQQFQKKLINLQEQISHKENNVKKLTQQLKDIEK